LTRDKRAPIIYSVIFARRHTRRAQGALSTMLAVAMLLFAHTCAFRGMACASPLDQSAQDYCATGDDADSDCGDHDGCGHGEEGACAHASMCCSTWAPPVATVIVSNPAAISYAFATGLSSLEPVTSFSPQLVPIPPESPPPLVSILRL
jgi:hypothetical protein